LVNELSTNFFISLTSFTGVIALIVFLTSGIFFVGTGGKKMDLDLGLNLNLDLDLHP